MRTAFTNVAVRLCSFVPQNGTLIDIRAQLQSALVLAKPLEDLDTALHTTTSQVANFVIQRLAERWLCADLEVLVKLDCLIAYP